MTKIHDVDDLKKLIDQQNEKIHTLDNLLSRLTEIVAVHHEIFVRQGICKSTGGEYVSGQKTN